MGLTADVVRRALALDNNWTSYAFVVNFQFPI